LNIAKVRVCPRRALSMIRIADRDTAWTRAGSFDHGSPKTIFCDVLGDAVAELLGEVAGLVTVEADVAGALVAPTSGVAVDVQADTVRASVTVSPAKRATAPVDRVMFPLPGGFPKPHAGLPGDDRAPRRSV
jgi:hypothetical protein